MRQLEKGRPGGKSRVPDRANRRLKAEHFLLHQSAETLGGQGLERPREFREFLYLNDQSSPIASHETGCVVGIDLPLGEAVGDGNRDWEESVKGSVRKVKTRHAIVVTGSHALKVWMVDPAVVLQKIVVDCGGLKPSYLGPPESPRR